MQALAWGEWCGGVSRATRERECGVEVRLHCEYGRTPPQLVMWVEYFSEVSVAACGGRKRYGYG